MQQQPPTTVLQSQTSLPTSTSPHSKRKVHPQRITQLQCLDSDSQLQLFFIQALNQSFKYLPGLLENIYNQIQLLVGLVQFRLTIAVGVPHPGDLLQNIRFKGKLSNMTKFLYLLFTVILPYLKRKVSGYLIKDPIGWKDKLLKIINFVDKIIMTLSLINFSIFIRFGRYRTLAQRILRIPMQFIDSQSTRILSFVLMNRKMIWRIYELFLRTVLPYTNELFGSTLKNIFYLNSYLQVQSNKQNQCMYCEQNVKMPMKGNCGHLSCYYCYSINFGNNYQEGKMDRRKYNCRICGDQLNQWKKLF